MTFLCHDCRHAFEQVPVIKQFYITWVYIYIYKIQHSNNVAFETPLCGLQLKYLWFIITFVTTL